MLFCISFLISLGFIHGHGHSPVHMHTHVPPNDSLYMKWPSLHPVYASSSQCTIITFFKNFWFWRPISPSESPWHFKLFLPLHSSPKTEDLILLHSVWERNRGHGSYLGIVNSWIKLKGIKEERMSKKVLTSMKDENPDLQKQMGCISGFFQLFDRHWFLTGSHKPTPGILQHFNFFLYICILILEGDYDGITVNLICSKRVMFTYFQTIIWLILKIRIDMRIKFKIAFFQQYSSGMDWPN